MTPIETKQGGTADSVLPKLNQAFVVFRDCLPLAIGIHKTIRERLPEITAGQLRAALRLHTASTRYLKVLSKAEVRFGLDALPEGVVSAEQREQALQTLRQRFQKKAERHRAEQLVKQQQEKLNKLVEKFNAR